MNPSSHTVNILQTPGLRLAYQRFGHGPSSLLFVHGSFATGRWWRPVVELLPAGRFTSYLLDLPGCGASDRPDDIAAYAIEQQAASLAAFIAGLGLADLHLVGHSLGAAIALTYAVQNPHLLRSLTLVSTPSPEGTPTPEVGLDLLAQMREDRSLLAQALASTMPARAPDLLFQQWVDDAMQQAPAAFTANALALAQWRLSLSSLNQLRLPVLLIWGDRDEFTPREVQRQLLLAIPGANNLEVFRNCGHTPFLERREGFVQALLTFIEQDFDAYAAIRERAE